MLVTHCMHLYPLPTDCLPIAYPLPSSSNNADMLANVLTGVTVEPLDGCVCLLKFVHVPRSLASSSTGHEKWINISIEMKNDTWQDNKTNKYKGAALEWAEVCSYHIQLKYLHENNPTLPNEMEHPELYCTQEQKKEMEQVLHHTLNSSSTKGGVSAGSAGSGGGTTSGTTTGIRRCVLSINPNLISPHLATYVFKATHQATQWSCHYRCSAFDWFLSYCLKTQLSNKPKQDD